VDANWILDRLIIMIPLWLSLSVHECAHAWAALRLGDETAYRLGRLTLNPVAHIDPVGTLLLPLLGVPFGWARPVPVNPMGFRRDVSPRKGMMITAAAGPISNVLLAFAAGVLFVLLVRFAPGPFLGNARLAFALQLMIFMNVVLALFNMLPIPPLDGSRIADFLMPYRLRPVWEGFVRFSPIALVAVIGLPILMGISLFAWPMAMVNGLLSAALRLVGV
jgi:Zn-dependent protease